MDDAPHIAHRRAAWALRIGVALQGLGLCWMAWRHATAIEGTIFLSLDAPEHLAGLIDRAGATLCGVAGASLLWRPTRTAWAWLGGWSALMMLAMWWQNASYFEGVTPFAWAIRMAGPWIGLIWIGPRARSPEEDACEAAPSAKLHAIATVAIAATFIAHGVEAWWHHPTFVDLILATSLRVTSSPPPQADVETILSAIGAIDIISAFMLVFATRRTRGVALWMTFWGALTAASRLTQWGVAGIDRALLRAMHAGLPLMVWWWWRAQDARAMGQDDRTSPES